MWAVIVRFGSLPALGASKAYVRFTSKADIRQCKTMSALGRKRTFKGVVVMSALGLQLAVAKLAAHSSAVIDSSLIA